MDLVLKVLYLLLLHVLSFHSVAAWTTTAPLKTKSMRKYTYSSSLGRKTQSFSPKLGFSSQHFQRLAASQRETDDAAVAASETLDDNKEEAEARILMERAKKARNEAVSMEQDLVQSKLQTLEDLLRQRQSKLSVADQKEIQDRIDQLKNYSVDSSLSSSSAAVDQKKERISKVAATSENTVVTTELNEVEERYPVDYVKELTPEDREVLEEMQSIVLEVEELFNETMIFADDDETQELAAELATELKNLLAGNITQEELELLRELGDIQKELKNDPSYLGRIELLGEVIPQHMIESEEKLNETAMDEFVKEVMFPISDVFSLESKKARRVGSAYLLGGTSELKSGDDLIEKIDKQLAMTGLLDKYQCYYIQDQTPLVDLDEAKIAEEIGNIGEDELVQGILERFINPGRPALMITSPNIDLAPALGPEYRAVISFLTVVATAFFASSCYDQDVSGITSPIFFGILGIQLLHEIGHFVASSLHKFDIAFPFTMYPSPGTGLLHTNTHIKSPPKNNNAMFDFALSGPLLGLAASWSTMLVGLKLTANVPSSQVALLPHVPLGFFQLSALTSATIQSFLGTDVLLSLDPISDNVAAHPLVIAGHVCILINALNLLPSTKTSDGGRMLTACLTRSNVLGGAIPFFCQLFLLVQGIRGWNSSNLLILYLFLVPWFQHPADVPCRNNVDPATGIRPLVFSFTSLLALIAVSPSF